MARDNRPPQVRTARRWLARHGGPIQQRLNEDRPGTYLIHDWNAEGEEIVYVTNVDGLIVDYFNRIQSGILLERFLGAGGRVGEG